MPPVAGVSPVFPFPPMRAARSGRIPASPKTVARSGTPPAPGASDFPFAPKSDERSGN
ncbi:hypothetical protein BT63DRAFT_427163 [Microthyrium microscopicum]|uniref:Uncharacterized protein n=1 Tax=Microthyrium microscopicum TaxID=703497 RepID=A0A6A6U393_9PEZI|nr:hypothetical protein BT63DRAFT_427163 [Microthyrium microscopicum]